MITKITPINLIMWDSYLKARYLNGRLDEYCSTLQREKNAHVLAQNHYNLEKFKEKFAEIILVEKQEELKYQIFRKKKGKNK